MVLFITSKPIKPKERIYEYTRSDYDKTFRIQKKIMKAVKIRTTHKPMSPLASKCWDVFYWFEYVNMWLAIILEFMSMVETACGGSFEDAIKIFRMMPCFGMAIIGMTKSFTIVYHRPVYENLVNEIGEMWPDGRVTEEEGAIIDKAYKQLLIVMRGYFWCNNALLISFIGIPVLESIKRTLGYDGQLILPFYFWMPFDPLQPGYVDVLLAVQTWQATVVVWCNVCGDLFFFAFLSHITTQLDLLSLKIQKLIYVPIDEQLVESYPLGLNSRDYLRNEATIDIQNKTNIEFEAKHQKELSDILLRHRSLIRLSSDVEDMFSFALLMNFLNSSVIICFSGFCIIVVEKWNEIAYKSFLLTALSQTFLICWYGQKLLDSSKGISHALYNSGWYKASHKIQTPILIMLHRAQKEVHITTYGFSVISLASYTQIMKTAWSYFTILLKTYKQ